MVTSLTVKPADEGWIPGRSISFFGGGGGGGLPQACVSGSLIHGYRLRI